MSVMFVVGMVGEGTTHTSRIPDRRYGNGLNMAIANQHFLCATSLFDGDLEEEQSETRKLHRC
jgi:hypothetical protein